MSVENLNVGRCGERSHQPSKGKGDEVSHVVDVGGFLNILGDVYQREVCVQLDHEHANIFGQCRQCS